MYLRLFAWLIAFRDLMQETMHDGPDVPEFGWRSTPAIRESLELLDRTLMMPGHSHWTKPLAELANGMQVLDVDASVVVLRQDGDYESNQ